MEGVYHCVFERQELGAKKKYILFFSLTSVINWNICQNAEKYCDKKGKAKLYQLCEKYFYSQC